MNLVQLPKDIINIFISLLKPDDLFSLSRVNKFFYAYLLKNDLWNIHHQAITEKNFSYLKKTIVNYDKIDDLVRAILARTLYNLEIYFHWKSNIDQFFLLQLNTPDDDQSIITYIFFFYLDKEQIEKNSSPLFSFYKKVPYSSSKWCYRPSFDSEEKFQLIRKIVDEHVDKLFKSRAKDAKHP